MTPQAYATWRWECAKADIELEGQMKDYHVHPRRTKKEIQKQRKQYFHDRYFSRKEGTEIAAQCS